MLDAMDANAIHVFDVWLLGLASVAGADGGGADRGRMGLTTPGVTASSPAGHRRRRPCERAMKAVDRLAEYVAVVVTRVSSRSGRLGTRSCVTPGEEMELVDRRLRAGVRSQAESCADAWAPDVSPERPPESA